jgi:redox-sensitive bicupin YhaK (pirin superfamily)
LGTVQTITPGAINWMTAGRGIFTVSAQLTLNGKERRQHGLQLWVALPPDQETVAPSFQHVAAADLPLIELEGGVQISVLAGSAFGRTSPVKTLSATLYLDVYLPPGHEFTLPVLASEMALYSPEHALVIDGQEVAGLQLVVLQQAPVRLCGVIWRAPGRHRRSAIRKTRPHVVELCINRSRPDCSSGTAMGQRFV